jgi:hypothetical protein
MNAPVRLTAATPDGAKDLIAKMVPGQAMIYHVGSLMHDRRKEGPYSRMVDEVARIFYSAFELGEITLVQKRIAPLVFEYIAIKRLGDAKRVGSKNRRNQSARRQEGSPTPV